MTQDLELNIIEIPKVHKLKASGREQKLKEWISFLENPESEEVSVYMEKNESMKKAKNKLDKMSKDEKVRRLAELRQKALMDEREAEYTGYCKGVEQQNKKIAKKMRENGADIPFIIKITGLSEEEILKL